MNKYKDKKGHFTNKENDNGECHHDFGSTESFDNENWEDLDKAEYIDFSEAKDDEYERIESNLEDAYEDLRLTNGEMLEISDYTSDNAPVNNYLRKVYETNTYDEELDEQIETISNVIDRFDLKDNLIVHRVSDDRMIKNAKVGDIVSDAGFVSTSVNTAGVGEYKSKHGRFMDYNYKILVPKGKGRGAWIARTSHFGFGENEFLIQKGSKFRILEIDDKDIKLELVVD